jgi:formiminoglutamate deiminase
MKTLFFNHALLADGFARNVRISADETGLITHVAANSPMPDSGAEGDIALPGMANLHSHAFQRAMAGLGEWRGTSAQDSFWSWREVMYRFVQRLRPQDLHAIAAQLYVEMLEAGFTAVGEFHYLHHQPDGTPYDDLGEMSQQLIQAANATGIGQTLLPVLYQQGGFDGAALSASQQRFYNDTDQFLTLVSGLQKAPFEHPRNLIGIAPHSLRAVSADALTHIMQANPTGPIHIHIAEQMREVEDCIAFNGTRPVQYLLDHAPVDHRWCLVHATHLDQAEITQLAACKAVAGLCPITEANLGDGVFAGVDYLAAGGIWGIGSDSHIRIDLAEELRSYEYSQRLRDLKRTRLAAKSQANGRSLFDAACAGGAQALAQNMGSIAVGNWCDIIALNASHPVLIGKSGDDWLNSWIFAGDKSCVSDVWVNGQHLVQNGQHIHRQKILSHFAKAMHHLMDG